MAGKFIELKEAAAQLGVTPEQLQEMREAGKIHGYKDGNSWKFKPSELARLSSEFKAHRDAAEDDQSFSDSASLSGDDFEQLLSVDDSSEEAAQLQDSSIVIGEDGSEGGGPESSSTVIGKEGRKGKDSDLRLAGDARDKGVGDAGSGSGGGKSAGDDYELKLADSDDLSDELAGSENLEFESDEAFLLQEDGDLSLSADSDESEDVVLDDSGSSEDSALPVGSSDSGIGVTKPSDSGLSLEADSGSAALELPEDEDMISLDDELSASPDDATQLQQDEEFLLSPSDEMFGDESSDSGSQVIALDDSGAFESDADVAALDSGEAMLVPEEQDALDVQLEPIDSAVAVSGVIPVAGAEAPEADYTAWNIMALVFVILLLGVTGMMMADIVRNMWGWSGDATATSSLANTIVDALGMK
jgi:excisionase family DNA binding protein